MSGPRSRASLPSSATSHKLGFTGGFKGASSGRQDALFSLTKSSSLQQSHMSAGAQGTGGLLDSYQIGKSIGQGAYAQVRLCLDKRDQQKYAMKVYEKYRLTDPMKRKAAQREITVLKRLDHPGIIHLHDLIDTPK